MEFARNGICKETVLWSSWIVMIMRSNGMQSTICHFNCSRTIWYFLQVFFILCWVIVQLVSACVKFTSTLVNFGNPWKSRRLNLKCQKQNTIILTRNIRNCDRHNMARLGCRPSHRAYAFLAMTVPFKFHSLQIHTDANCGIFPSIFVSLQFPPPFFANSAPTSISLCCDAIWRIKSRCFIF